MVFIFQVPFDRLYFVSTYLDLDSILHPPLCIFFACCIPTSFVCLWLSPGSTSLLRITHCAGCMSSQMGKEEENIMTVFVVHCSLQLLVVPLLRRSRRRRPAWYRGIVVAILLMLIIIIAVRPPCGLLVLHALASGTLGLAAR